MAKELTLDHFPPATIKTLSHSLAISDQAKKLIRHIPDFDLEDFARHFLKKGIPVGSNNVLEYLIATGPKAKEIATNGCG